MKILALLLICLFPVLTYAQTVAEITFAEDSSLHYVFPTFHLATVKMKKGEPQKAMMNYNLVTEEMVFMQNDKVLALYQLNEIDTVYFDQRKFIPEGNKFMELLYNAPLSLYILHKRTLMSTGKTAAYGGKSQLSAVSSVESLTADGTIYRLKLPGEYVTSEASQFYTKDGKKLRRFANVNQLSKIFPAKASVIHTYVKENSIDFKNKTQVMALIKFLNN